ncbi:hypothetical protein AVEN_206877-1 [Araneus ventricosus]|uniref:Uncharacterized protein n=1 Tax=Araneus ventricosus TaxID=182803 RepID=A0A4Y2QGA3_ARAVE|nr:hypothetical protein AVEN_206877-1 [Araneus ventricosus]
MIFTLQLLQKRQESLSLLQGRNISFIWKNNGKIESQKIRKTVGKENELNYLKSKKAFLQDDITAMENSAEEVFNKAESSKIISLFIKANALQRDIEEKPSEIKELDSQIFEKEK